jgi:ferredoxin
MELERLANSAGPTVGRLVRPRTARAQERGHDPVRRLARQRYNEYCSGFCCMYTIKNALLLKQADPEMDITIFYMDIRTPSKGYEEFYNRAREMGIRFIQGRPSQITEDPVTGNLYIEAEDQALGEVIELEAEMVMPLGGGHPALDTEQVGLDADAVAQPRAAFTWSTTPSCGRWIRPRTACSWPAPCRGRRISPPAWPRAVRRPRARRGCSLGYLGDRADRRAGVGRSLRQRPGPQCGLCATACPYGAITVEPGPAGIRSPRPSATAAAAALPSAPRRHHAGSLYRRPDRGPAPSCCATGPRKRSWPLCATGAATVARTMPAPATLSIRPSSRGIRVMCSARMDQDFHPRGVPPGRRYGAGIGLPPAGLPLYHGAAGGGQALSIASPARWSEWASTPSASGVEWISAAEGEKYARVITEMDAKARSHGQGGAPPETAKAQPEIAKRLRRWAASPAMADLMLEEEEVSV